MNENGRQVGKITKRFSGVFTELGTDADKFDVEFMGPIPDQGQRLRMLMMAFVIDMKHFEDKSGNSAAEIGIDTAIDTFRRR